MSRLISVPPCSSQCRNPSSDGVAALFQAMDPATQFAQNLFAQLDANGDGNLTQSELEQAVTNAGGHLFGGLFLAGLASALIMFVYDWVQHGLWGRTIAPFGVYAAQSAPLDQTDLSL